MKKVGILALQGAFIAHKNMLKKFTNVEIQLVRYTTDLTNLDAMILPGGESSVIYNLLKKHSLLEVLKTKLQTIPVLATCAGMILLQKLNLVDIKIQLNGYGHQIASKVIKIPSPFMQGKFITGMLIRAPIVTEIYDTNIKVLSLHNNIPILLCKDNLLLSSFHTELTNDNCLHKRLIS